MAGKMPAPQEFLEMSIVARAEEPVKHQLTITNKG